jgi:hypothetical protein
MRRAREPFTEETELSELEQILSNSHAADAFKNSVRTFCANGDAEHIRIEGFAPAVKVRRLLAHILETESHLPIERVSLRGRSGCSDFVGTVKVETKSGTHVYEFIWDCRWRAEQEGWTDYFGFPDQIRAAREYDWRCFARWELAS